MVGGGQRSPSHHPTRSNGGRVAEVGSVVAASVVFRDGVRSVSGDVSGERRFSFGRSGGLAKIGAEESRVVQVQITVEALGAGAGSSIQRVAAALKGTASQNGITTEEMELG